MDAVDKRNEIRLCLGAFDSRRSRTVCFLQFPTFVNFQVCSCPFGEIFYLNLKLRDDPTSVEVLLRTYA